MKEENLPICDICGIMKVDYSLYRKGINHCLSCDKQLSERIKNTSCSKCHGAPTELGSMYCFDCNNPELIDKANEIYALTGKNIFM